MNNLFLLRWLSTRFLKSERSDKFLSAATVVAVLGMAFGVASLYISLSIINGFQKTYKESLLKFNSHLVLTKADEIQDPKAIIDKLIPPRMRAEILGWNPFIYREGMIIAGSEMRGIVIKGVDLDRFGNLSQMKIDINPGYEKGTTLPSLILGKNLIEQLGGSSPEVRLLFPTSWSRDKIGTPKKFRIVGVFESGLYEYDSNFAFVSLQEAQKFFQMGGRVSGIEIWLKNPDRAAYWVEQLQQEFPFPYVVLGWRDINENLFRALELEKAIFFILMMVLTAVASLNVLASLIMLLLQKREQIAVLRALGLPWPRLRKIFLFDGLLIGFVGFTLGFVLALGALFVLERWEPVTLSAEVYFISHVPVEYSWINFFWVVGVGLALVWIGCVLTLRGLSKLPILRSLTEA